MGNGKRPALWSIPLEGEVARAVWGQMGEGGGGRNFGSRKERFRKGGDRERFKKGG